MAASSATNFLTRDFRVREPLLVGILVVITIVFSALAHTYSQAYDRRRAALGVQWFERGNEELQNNRPEVAIEDFRTALFYDPQNWNFSMQLANALTVADHTDQALNYYLGLWQCNPSSGPVNLQLARLYARPLSSVGAARKNPLAYPCGLRCVRTARHGTSGLLPRPAERSGSLPPCCEPLLPGVLESSPHQSESPG